MIVALAAALALALAAGGLVGVVLYRERRLEERTARACRRMRRRLDVLGGELTRLEARMRELERRQEAVEAVVRLDRRITEGVVP